ncbi:hypothetical protein RUM43_000716 [Polyplax serrata]|uniref:Ig-like domain-containing protein n=1 Tax=Polyplax serrata TaxID=468196 RepID=A0AAN8SEB6_POLSC
MAKCNVGGYTTRPLVPPDIIDEETSSDVTVREGENATLVCRAKGHPVPRIIWKREDGDHLQFKSGPREIVRDKSERVRERENEGWDILTKSYRQLNYLGGYRVVALCGPHLNSNCEREIPSIFVIIKDKFNERRKQIEVLWLPFMAERIKLAFLVLDINAGCHFTFAKEWASSHLWQRARHGVNEKK